MTPRALGFGLWIAAVGACAAGNGQPPQSGVETVADSCAQLAQAAQRANEAAQRGAWGSVAQLTVDAELQVDACTDTAARERYQAARRRLADELAHWRLAQADLVSRIQADTAYIAAVHQQAEVLEARASFAAAEVARNSPSRRSSASSAGQTAAERAQLRVREHAARAQVVTVLQGFGLGPEEARLLGLLR